MKPCILLIEDDSDMRELVGGHLEHNGFDVQRADDGIKGQALALQYTPDLILLDLMLPKVDGLTLCQRLRRDERTAGIPILMLTALGGTKDKVSGFNSGADDYLTKPFSPRELVLRVNAVLRRAHVQLKAVSGEGRILRAGPLRVVVGAHVVTRQAGRRGRVDRNGAGVRVPVPESCRVRTGGLAGATAAGRG